MFSLKKLVQRILKNVEKKCYNITSVTNSYIETSVATKCHLKHPMQPCELTCKISVENILKNVKNSDNILIRENSSFITSFVTNGD